MATPRPASLLGAVGAALLVVGCGGSTTPAQTPPASGEPSSPRVTIAAQDIAFDTVELRVAANQPFTIIFENREAVPHNVSIDRAGTQDAPLFQGAVFTGPATRWYAVPALAPGAYTFLCQVHPSMAGRLIAG